jgi:hypothetical protein
VGKMLAQGGDFTYVSEPLNVWHRPGVMRTPVAYWYTYICEENQERYLEAFEETLRLQYHTWREVRSLRSLKDLLRMARDWTAFAQGRLGGRRALLKDPFAAFSVPWFAERLGCQVVFVVRHPAAFVSSLKRLGWTFNFRHLLEQPLLMRDWLEPFRAEMETASRQSEDLVYRASLLWRVIYYAADEYRTRTPEFQLVRHEDLSLKPLEEFEALYEGLGLAFTARARRGILKATGADNPSEVSMRSIYSVKLDSRANLKNWQKRLTEEEIARVRELTGDVAGKFYTEEDWE